MLIIFWLSVFFIAYTYILYPLLVIFFSELKSVTNEIPVGYSELPTVAVIVAVHNGESYIQKKLKSLLSQDYPQEKISIIFSSDGSSDNTVNILESYPMISLIKAEVRQGKAAALNHAVASTDAEVIVFTDVRQRLSSNAIFQLVTRLSNENVGAVSGELLLEENGNVSSAQLGLYWRYEKMIRKAESKLHSVPGVTGALYAIYRCDYPQLNENTLLDDFEVPIAIIRKGKRVIFEPSAIAYDKVSESLAVEKKRKIRTIMGNYQSFGRNPWLFSPRLNPIFWQFISHKVCRLIVPYCLLMMLFIPLFIGGPVYQGVFLLQIIFYSVAFLSKSIKSSGLLSKILSFSHVFLMMQVTVVIALYKYCVGQADAKWEQLH